MNGFRKYFSTIQQLNKISNGYYRNDEVEEDKKTIAAKSKIAEMEVVSEW